MDLLERADALGVLDELLEATATGGRIAIVSGEAGAGKSALVGTFAARVGNRARVLWGACDPLLTPRALGPLHDIAREVGGQLGERLAHVDKERGRAAVFDALLGVLADPRQRPRPLVVMDDLHWADEATLDLVAFLGRRLERYRALLIVTYRDDEVGPEHPLRTVLAGLPRPLARRLAVAPLSVAGVAELARRAGRSPTGVHGVTGGNPLLVTEVLAAPEAGVPPTVRDLVLSRLAALSPPARELAGLVSIVPSGAESALLGADPAAVEECLARGVLVSSGDRVAFRHELLRRAVEESLSPPRRTALHAAVLAALTSRAAAPPDGYPPAPEQPAPRGGDSGVDPARLVHHAHHADDAAAVLRWAPVAARRAAAVGAHRQAAAHYRTALPRAIGLPAAERAELLEAYSFSSYLAGLAQEALDARRLALALREAGGEPERIGENLRWVSRLAWWTGRTAEGRSAGLRAVHVLEQAPQGRQLAMAYSNLSQLYMLADEDQLAIAWGVRALTLARRLNDPETRAHALINMGTARMQRGEPAGRLELERGYAAAAAAGLDDHAGRALLNLGTAPVVSAEYAEAVDALDRALAYTTARDLDGYVRHLLGHRAAVRLALGSWDAARADAEQALAGLVESNPSAVSALVPLGRLRARRGEPDALPLLEQAAGLAYKMGELQFVAPTAAALAEYYWLIGDPERAAAEARRAMPLAIRARRPWSLGELCFWQWRVGEPAAPPPAEIAEPYRLTIDGDWAGAAAAWAARGCGYQRALALAGGDAAAARQALRILDGLGAAGTARRLRAELRERGVGRVPRGPRPATAANPRGLTARQLEVAALLADGLSNAEIAGRLSVSAKTVDHHVSAVLGKLRVTSRGQAAVAARRLGLIPPQS